MLKKVLFCPFTFLPGIVFQALDTAVHERLPLLELVILCGNSKVDLQTNFDRLSYTIEQIK